MKLKQLIIKNFTKKTFAIIILFFIPLFFKEFVRKKLNALVIEPFFSTFNWSSDYVFILFCMFIGVIFIYLLYKLLKYKYSIPLNLFIIISGFAAWYLVERLCGEEYYALAKIPGQFSNYLPFGFEFYLDLLLILYPVFFLFFLFSLKPFSEIDSHAVMRFFKYRYLKFMIKLQLKRSYKNRKHYNQKGSKGFVIDAPIKMAADDETERKNYAGALINKLYETDLSNSFIVGIEGPWGSGKSSFFTLLKYAIKKRDIAIDFSPWLSHSSEAYISLFFDTLREKLGKYHFGISGHINNYYLDLVDGSGFLRTLFTPNRSLSKQKELINHAIEKINRKVFIFIDDLDRLDKTEVIETLKLIRNTADFKNCCFFVAYEKKYIMEAIKDLPGTRKHNYLEKVFNLELNLPVFEEMVIIDKLREMLQKRFKNSIDPQKLREIFQGIYNEGFSVFDLLAWFGTFRETKKFFNCFLLHYDAIKEEGVCLKDLFCLEMIRYKFPHIIDVFYENKFYYLETSREPFPEIFYCLKEKEMNEYLKKETNENTKDNELIGKLFKALFPKKDTKTNQHEFDKHAIKVPINIYKYFSFRKFKGAIGYKDYEDGIKNEKREFYKKVREWVEQGKEFELEYWIRNSKVKSSYEFENLYYVLKEESKDGIISTKRRLHVDIDAFVKIMKRNCGNNADFTKEKAIENLAGKLKNAKAPYNFESQILYALRNDDEADDDFKDLISNSDDFFDNYLKTLSAQKEEIDDEIIQVYTSTIVYKKDIDTNTSIPETSSKMRKSVIELINKNFEAFLDYAKEFKEVENDYERINFIRTDWLKILSKDHADISEFIRKNSHYKKNNGKADEVIRLYTYI